MPSWVPLSNANLTEDRVGYVAAPGHALNYRLEALDQWPPRPAGDTRRRRVAPAIHCRYLRTLRQAPGTRHRQADAMRQSTANMWAAVKGATSARCLSLRPSPSIEKYKCSAAGNLHHPYHVHNRSNRFASTSVSVARSTRDGRANRNHRSGTPRPGPGPHGATGRPVMVPRTVRSRLLGVGCGGARRRDQGWNESRRSTLFDRGACRSLGQHPRRAGGTVVVGPDRHRCDERRAASEPRTRAARRGDVE